MFVIFSYLFYSTCSLFFFAIAYPFARCERAQTLVMVTRNYVSTNINDENFLLTNFCSSPVFIAIGIVVRGIQFLSYDQYLAVP